MDYLQATLTTHSDSREHHPRIVAGQYGTWAQLALRTNQCDLGLRKMQEHLEIRESIFAKIRIVDSHIAAAYSETARAMLMNGRFSEARTLIDRSIELRKQMPNFSCLQLHNPLMYLAWIDWYEGDHHTAVDGLLELLHNRLVQFGKDDQEGMRSVAAFTMNHLMPKLMNTCRAGELLYFIGRIRDDQGLVEDSFEYQQRALRQFRATLGEDDFYTGLAYYQVAVHTMCQEDLSTAK